MRYATFCWALEAEAPSALPAIRFVEDWPMHESDMRLHLSDDAGHRHAGLTADINQHMAWPDQRSARRNPRT